MSTNNFKYENILVVIPDFNFYHDCDYGDCDDIETGECKRKGYYVGFNQYAYDEYISDMQEQLQKIGFESCDTWDNDRIYNGKIIADYRIYDKKDYEKKIEVVIRNGYYDGANIDYTIEDDCIYKETKTQEKKIASKVRQLEKVLRKYGGEEYLKVASFSNGEAIYQKKLTNK